MIDFGCGIQLFSMTNHGDAMVWRNDPKIWRWTRQNDLISYEDHQNWFDRQSRDPSIKMYRIFRGPAWIGVAGFTSIDLHNRRAEFSLYIEPKSQGNGYSKPALKTLFYHGFKNMGLRSIWGETFEDNPAQKIFRDIGMHEDGKRRQFYYKDGEFCDAILFSILSEEFLACHGEATCFG